MASKALEVERLTVMYPGGFTAVREVSFEVDERCHTAIIGPNGAGKSTLLKAITGEVRIAEGSVTFFGRTITRSTNLKRATEGLIRTRQDLGLFGSMTVRDNIMCGADRHQRRDDRSPNRATTRNSARKRTEDVIELLGLERWAGTLPRELPYGSRKLVEFGRALAAGPKLLLLDEPVAGLNTAEKGHVANIIKTAVEQLETTLVLVEHDMTTVRELCSERVVAMVAGAVVAHGTFFAVVQHEDVRAAYLGERTAGRVGKTYEEQGRSSHGPRGSARPATAITPTEVK